MKSIFLAASILASSPVSAQEVLSGPAEVIDGDTIKIATTTIRLNGIDAPEMDQALGNWSRIVLVDAIRGRELVCAWDEVGRYGRPLATCAPVLESGRVSSVSINGKMVRAGAAAAGLRYGYKYERQQSLAMKACIGMWARIGLPWCHRDKARGGK